MGETRVEEVEAGREMDAAVAVAWLGWRWIKDAVRPGESLLAPPEQAAPYLPEYVSEQIQDGQEWCGSWHSRLPYCSTDEGAAWLAVKGLNAAGWNVEITSYCDGLCDVWVRYDKDPTKGAWARGLPAPEAICRAALLALEKM